VSEHDGYATLRRAIVSGELQPNQRLVEAELGATYGLGRAALRTAFVRLEQDGLVLRERHRGARVRLVSEEEAVEILEARAALEGVAIRRTAAAATDADIGELRALLVRMRERLDAGDLIAVSALNGDLHRRLLEMSDHGTAQRLCSLLHSQTVRFQYRTILVPGRPERSLAEHSAVVDAIAAHDPDAAERALREHLDNVTDTLRGAA
jgi:DNA-binding GntR family transcriptional regulator